jgi:hypothetical protein
MINKLISKGNISVLENNITNRLSREKKIFGNKIQLSEIKILELISELKNNEDYLIKPIELEA